MTVNCYCIALRRAERKVTSIYDEALKPAGVNIAQFSLLRAIDRSMPVSLSKLGKLTELDRSTVGRNVRVLSRMALVKMLHGEDQREAVVVLTEKARNALVVGAPLWLEAQQKIENTLGVTIAKRLRGLSQRL